MHASAVVPSTSPTLQAKERQARKMAARREQAFQELYDCHWKDVRNYVVWFLDGCRDVEDVVQEVFLRVYERLDDYDPTRPARPWLFRISSNVALNLVEEQMAQKRSVEDGQTVSLSRMSSEGDFIVDVPDHREMLPEEHAVQEETIGRLRSLLADLPEHDRDVIHSLHCDGMSQREAAKALDIPRETVRDHNQRLLETLRTRLESDPAA